MTARVEVQPLPLKFYAGSIILAVVSVLLLALGGWLTSQPTQRETGTVFLVLGGLAATAPVVNFIRRSRRRATLEADTGGVTITTRGRTERYAYDEIESVALQEKQKLSNGEPAGWTRRLAVRGASGAFAVVAFSAVHEPDEMAAFLHEMVEGWLGAARARLDRGLEIRGRGWTLDSASFRPARTAAPVPWGAIAQAAIAEGRVSLWRRGEDLPFFRVDAGSPNAHTLLELVMRATAGQPDEPLGADQLGRVLFEKRSRSIMAVITLCLGMGLLFASWMVRDLLAPLAVILGAGGLAVIARAVWSLTSRIRVHQEGIARLSLLGRRVLLYRDVTRFTYAATRYEHNGAYTGTGLTMTLAPESPGRPIRFSTLVYGSDQDLDELRAQIADQVAQRLFDVVSGGGEVGWGKDARITAREVQGRRSGFLGKKKATVPIGPEMQEQLHEGRLLLSAGGSKEWLLDVGCGEENFYPGHLVLSRLVEEARPRELGGEGQEPRRRDE